MQAWKATHEIRDGRYSVKVMLCLDPIERSGPAYTKAEWEQTAMADYGQDVDGSWLFQGKPFTGKVKRIVPKAVSRYTAEIGRKGGSSTSDRKAASSRANGLKGGRPKATR